MDKIKLSEYVDAKKRKLEGFYVYYLNRYGKDPYLNPLEKTEDEWNGECDFYNLIQSRCKGKVIYSPGGGKK